MSQQETDPLSFYWATLTGGLREAVLLLIVFLVGGVLYYHFFVRRRAGSGARTGLRDTFGYLFRRDLYGHPSARSDRWNFALTYLVWIPITRVALTAVLTVLSLPAFFGFLVDVFGEPVQRMSSPSAVTAFQFLCLFLGAELGAYLAHLLLHRVPLLWSIHRVHHSAEALTVFTRLRDHPIEFIWAAMGRTVLGAAFAAPFLFIAGTPPSMQAIILYFTVASMLPFLTDAWRHCHLPMSLGWFNRIFNAPVMHQIHHSAETRHFDKNIGAELMIFDWLFGTLYLPEPDEKYRWGLNEHSLGEDNPHNRLRDFYLEPFRYARSLMRRRSKEPVAAAPPIVPTEAV